MIKLYLHQLIRLDPTNEHKYWPETFTHMVACIEENLKPKKKPDAEAAKELAEDIGEDAPAPRPEPAEQPKPGTFDRTPVLALIDWCKDNDEPWMEKAFRFLDKHRTIRIKHELRYGDDRYEFESRTMPERWRSISNYDKGLAILFAKLAEEIEERFNDLL